MDDLITEHYNMVLELSKPGQDIADALDANTAHVLHMTIGISGEAGELLDAIKKWVIYGKDLDVPNIIEELGDLEYYMQGLRQGLGISRMQCLDANVAKLRKRYPAGKFIAKDAIARADKDGD